MSVSHTLRSAHQNLGAMVRNLNTLSILHYVYGGLVCFSGVAMLLLISLGAFLSSDFLAQSGETPPPAWLGGLFQGLGWFLFAFLEVLGLLIISSGRWIAKRKNRTGSMVLAGFCCLNFPLGTALGIFTFVALSNEEVKHTYGMA